MIKMENRSEAEVIDREAEFLASKEESGNEWEMFKENVRPLKRGRKVGPLNHALRSHASSDLRNSLLQHRKLLIKAIDDYEGDDPLHPWIQCIKWVQEAFPAAGDSSGLLLIYEQCVRTFWHSETYRDDLRYLKVWLEYAQHCADAEIIYRFLESNDIGKTHSAFYLAYASHMESKSKTKAANQILNLGISRGAQPVEKLRDAYKDFLLRSMTKPKPMQDDAIDGSKLQVRSFGTVIGENGQLSTVRNDPDMNKLKPIQVPRTPLSVYKDTNTDVTLAFQPKAKNEMNPWRSLGSRAERNKENNALPTKWTTYKVPQKPWAITGGHAPTATHAIDVFVDEELAENRKRCKEKSGGGGSAKLREWDDTDMKRYGLLFRETELLRENPLRNFPPNSLPR